MASLPVKGNETSNALCLQMMEKLTNPIPQLTLKEMCLRKIVVNLWNADDMLLTIQNFQSDGDFRKKWRETLEVQMKYKVLNLGLPESLKKKVGSLVRPVGSDLLRWKTDHELFLYKSHEKTIYKHTMKQIRWTCAGAIDYLKTAEELVCLEIFDVEERYILACSYCLEKEIRFLWEQLPEKRKAQYDDRRCIGELRALQLEYYWPYILKGEEHLLPQIHISFNKLAFNFALALSNKTVIEYFFHKLTSEEKDDSLFLALSSIMWRYDVRQLNWDHHDVNRLDEVFFFLLSTMNSEQLMNFFKEDPVGVLFCLRDWPWHDVFIDIMDVIWTFLPANRYDRLIYVMWNSGCYSPNLFQRFFKTSPKNFRRYFVKFECQYFRFFPEFFHDGDTETIKIVFENLEVEDRLKLISCNGFFKLVDGMIMEDKWDLIELCFEKATLSKNFKTRLKYIYKNFLKETKTNEMARVGQVESREHRWKQALDLLDKFETMASNKKILGNEAVIKNKRLQ